MESLKRALHLNILSREILENAVNKGFSNRDVPRPIAEHVALIHTEVSEIFEAHRDGMSAEEMWYQYSGTHPMKLSGQSSQRALDENGVSSAVLGKPVGIPSEIADVIIRCLNFCAEYDIDIDQAIEEKMAYNLNRLHLHGRAR